MRISNYLINLDQNTLRLKNSYFQFDKIHLAFEKISACSRNHELIRDRKYLTPVKVQANWYSHRKAFSEFLKTDSDFAFICEDDVNFTEESKVFFKNLCKAGYINIDILQIGYLGKNYELHRVLHIKSIMLNTLLQIVKKLNNGYFNKIASRSNNRLLHFEFIKNESKNLGISRHLVRGFAAGTHAYLINRRTAQALLKYNLPPVFGADLAFQLLSTTDNWKIYRTPKSFAIQDDSPADIGEHSRLSRDFASILI